MVHDPNAGQGPDPLDPEERYRGRALIDFHNASLFRRALRELPKLSMQHRGAGYSSVTTLQELSARNLDAVRRDCRNIVPKEEDRNRFLQRFNSLRFYWKHGTTVFSMIQESQCLTSTTRLVEHVHGPAVTLEKDTANPDDEEDYYHTFVPDPDRPGRMIKKKFVSTTKFEYDFSGDAGFIFFRYNLGSHHAPNTRFGEGGGVQLVLDPRQDTRLHTHGWITLRDVMEPYTRRAYTEGNFAITANGWTTQRLTTYEQIPDHVNPHDPADNGPLTMAELTVLGNRLQNAPGDLAHNERQYYLHQFRGEAVFRPKRWEHVMEGAFFGPDINEGIAYSAMRAFREIPPLWQQVISPALQLDEVEPFMRIWLHRFFHIEAKYPWKLPLPAVDTVAAPNGDDQDGNPVPVAFGDTGALVYFLPAAPETADGVTWDESGSAGSDDTTSTGSRDSLDYASDASLEATIGWA